MLLTQKAYVEGSRALVMFVAQLSDQRHGDTDKQTSSDSSAMVALLTPVLKAFISDAAVECTSLAIQVFGGHGYIRETGVEQHLRDCRIIPLYEGSNGIQAQDLLKRKVLLDGGTALNRLLEQVQAVAGELAGDEALGDLAEPLRCAVDLLRQATAGLLARADDGRDGAGAVAAPYLRLVGHVCLAWMWARMAITARAMDAPGDPLPASKIATARFYFAKVLPEVHALVRVVAAGAASVMDEDTALA